MGSTQAESWERYSALSAFEISYPARDKAEFDALVEHMEEDSLTAPR